LEPLEDRRLLASAKIEVYPGGSIHNSSTATANSFRIYNTSADGREIASVTIDLRGSLLPDVIYDPNGTGGDVVGIPFTANTGAAATGQTTHAFSSPRDGGFDALAVNFTDFDAGEMFGFRVDIDPTSVKGSAQPGPEHAASVSGLELSGATVTIRFDDDTALVGEIFALDERAPFYRVHSEVTLTEEAPLATPSISLVGAATPAIVQAAQQTVRVSGPAGAAVRLLQTEVALHLAGVPGGGYDIDPFEANKVIVVRDDTATIGAGGFVDIPITLSDTLTAGGINYFVAVIDAGARTGPMSNVLKVALHDLPPGSLPLVPIAGDFDADNDVDGADFLHWQRGDLVAEELDDWAANFGAESGDAAISRQMNLDDPVALIPELSKPTTPAARSSFMKPWRGIPAPLVDQVFSEVTGWTIGGRFRRGSLR
jgi:hypothetical protein